MSYVSPEKINEAKQIDLLTYLQNYEPDNLVRVSTGIYSTREHDSVKISNGLWFRWSTGIGGKSALDYLIKVRELSLPEAVETILGNVAERKPVWVKTEPKKKPKKLLLPDLTEYPDTVPHYLMCNRGIDFEVVDYCFNNGLIYESLPYHNAVFVGYDEHNIPRYAAFRASNSERIMGDCSGSNKEYSFRLLGDELGSKIHLFECAIDLLSYATLLKIKGSNWQDYNLISLSGVYQPKKEITQSKLPVTLFKYLKEHPQTDTIYLHFDNDKTGRLATKTIQTLIPKDIKVIDNPPPIGKDVNAFLLYLRDYSIPLTQIFRDINREISR